MSCDQGQNRVKTYVVFDRKTGEVLQTHVQVGGHHDDPEDLLKTARPEARAGSVGLLEVRALVPGTTYRVDPKTKDLAPVPGAKSRAPSGGAAVQYVRGDPQGARTVIVRGPGPEET